MQRALVLKESSRGRGSKSSIGHSGLIGSLVEVSIYIDYLKIVAAHGPENFTHASCRPLSLIAVLVLNPLFQRHQPYHVGMSGICGLWCWPEALLVGSETRPTEVARFFSSHFSLSN